MNPNLQKEYTNLLATMEVRPEWKSSIDSKARKIISLKDKYQSVAKATGVPWDVIAVIHSLEGNLDFSTHLHNGDPLTRRTRNVPRGRPVEGEPPFSWEESAIDAIKYDELDLNTDWSMEGIAYAFEKYNGLGYRTRNTGINSPYLWSGTTHYTRGKFVSDGKYSKTAKSEQIGAIPLLTRVRELDISPKEIVKHSSKLTLLKRLRIMIVTFFTSLFSASNIDAAKEYVNYVKQFATDNWFWMLLGGSAVAWLIFKWLEFLSVEDYKSGRYTPSKMEEGDTE